MTVTAANAPKIISVATGLYWVFAAWVMWGDMRSGDWLNKGGSWIGLVLLTGLCGIAFWAMMAPAAVRAFRSGPRPFSLWRLGMIVWCLSTVPVVLFCLGLFLCLVYYA